LYNSKKIGKIAVLAGGPSSERDISIKSGLAVYNALRRRGCDVEWLEIGKDNIKPAIESASFDVAFIALHGRIGEDGTIQKMLEQLSRPYTGSGVTASRLALDKIASRRIFKKSGIPVPEYSVLTRRSVKLPAKLLFPVVVKPQREGSSIGLSLARNKKQFKKACKTAFKYDSRIIAEKFIRGREITVGILGNDALPVVEVVPKRTFYDFRAKYMDEKTKYKVPASLGRRLYKRAQALGLAAYNALDCSDFSRVDMLLGEDNEIYVLEVNTIPGLTERSLLPKAANARGINFDRLCLKLLQLAVKNRDNKK